MKFVSYSRADSEFALRLAQDLRAAQIDVWIDQLSIRPGDRWDAAVEAALLGSTDVLLILSPDAVTSQSVMDETSYALEEHKNVIPIVYRPCRIPLRIGRLQALDFTKQYDIAFKTLCQSLSIDCRVPTGRTGLETDPQDEVVVADSASAHRVTIKRAQGRGAAVFGVIGAVSGLAAQMLIDTSPDTLDIAFATVYPGILWALIGAVCAMKRVPIIWAAVAYGMTVILSVLGTGIRAGLATAIVFLGPMSAIVPAAIGRIIADRAMLKVTR